jgi:hypothetical protein
MAGSMGPRFRSREAALRFYFRARELLTPNQKPGIFSKKCPARDREGPNVIVDFRLLDACFRGMDDAQLWLLREMYGPGGFGVKARSVAKVFETAQRKFPKYDWTPERSRVSNKTRCRSSKSI